MSVQFYDILTRFIINDFETNRNENTMTKKSTEAKYFGKTEPSFCQISVSNTSARLQLSAVILTIRNWHHIVQTSGNLNFSSTLDMRFLRQHMQLVAVYKQYGSVQGYLKTSRYPEDRYPWFHQTFVMKLLTNTAFTHCSSVHCLEIFP